MDATIIIDSFDERKPIIKDEIQEVLNIPNEHTFNQTLSYLVSFGILKRFENGIYYIPSSKVKFSELRPSLSDVVQKKYLENYQGIRTGAYLLYKYKFTTQVSSFYEILSNNVSRSTRSKHLYNGKVIVSYPPFDIDRKNSKILEFLELLKHMHYSDRNIEESKNQLHDVMKKFCLSKKEILHYSQYYRGKRYGGFRKLVRKVVCDELAS